MKPSLSIIVPTFNEAPTIVANLGKLNRLLSTKFRSHEILIIDDSSDDTPTIIKRSFKNSSSIKVIHRKSSDGLGGAMKLGLSKASADKCLLIDADLSQPINEIPKMISKLDSAAMVIGSRNISGGNRIGSQPFKVLGSNTLNLLARILLYPKIHDSTHSFRAVSKQAYNQIATSLNATKHPSFCIQLTYLINLSHPVLETPVTFKEIAGRQSHFPLKRAINSGKDALYTIFKLALRESSANP